MSVINITKRKIDSKSELKENLRNTDYPSLIIGEDSESEVKFYIFEGNKGFNTQNLFQIGIISEGHGLEPDCKIIDERYLLIGLNSEVHIIDIINLTKNNKIVLDSLFYEFILLNSKDKFIVLYELGIICVSIYGSILWEYSTDVINDYKIYDSIIKIITD